MCVRFNHLNINLNRGRKTQHVNIFHLQKESNQSTPQLHALWLLWGLRCSPLVFINFWVCPSYIVAVRLKGEGCGQELLYIWITRTATHVSWQCTLCRLLLRVVPCSNWYLQTAQKISSSHIIIHPTSNYTE